MIIYGVALLSLCTLAGLFIGEILGVMLGVPANVGGVGIAMLLLIFVGSYLGKRGLLSAKTEQGVEFWSAVYIPIVVAMAAQQNVLGALSGGPAAILAGIAAVAVAFALVPLLDRFGRPRRRQDGLGHSLAYRYDPAGRLTRLTNENGAHAQFQYDARNRLSAETGFDGRRQHYRYDVAGELIEQIEYPDSPDARRSVFERDAQGRLLVKHTAGGDSRFRYDAAGRLIEARNDQARVLFAYDALGQILRETTVTAGQEWTLQYGYDPLGNRTQTTLPDGRQANYLYYGSGHLHQINLDGEVLLDIERDDLHRETLRSQGKLESRFAYDTGGRLRYHGVFERGGPVSKLPPSRGNPLAMSPRQGDPLAWEALGGSQMATLGRQLLGRGYR